MGPALPTDPEREVSKNNLKGSARPVDPWSYWYIFRGGNVSERDMYRAVGGCNYARAIRECVVCIILCMVKKRIDFHDIVYNHARIIQHGAERLPKGANIWPKGSNMEPKEIK